MHYMIFNMDVKLQTSSFIVDAKLVSFADNLSYCFPSCVQHGCSAPQGAIGLHFPPGDTLLPEQQCEWCAVFKVLCAVEQQFEQQPFMGIFFLWNSYSESWGGTVAWVDTSSPDTSSLVKYIMGWWWK